MSDGQNRMSPETVAAIQRWLQSNGISLDELQGQTQQHSGNPFAPMNNSSYQGSPQRSDSLPNMTSILSMLQGQTQEHAPQAPDVQTLMSSLGSPKRSDSLDPTRSPYSMGSQKPTTPYAPGGVTPPTRQPDPAPDPILMHSTLGLPGTLAFDPTALAVTAGNVTPGGSSNASDILDQHGVHGGPDVPYTRGMTEGPQIGPVAPGLPGGVDLEKKHKGNGNLKAINALMELASNAPTPGDSAIDIGAIMKDAAGAASAPFRAQIQSTKHQNQRAKADTEYGSKQIRKMYRALSRSNKNAARRESNQSMDAAQQMQDMSAASADELAADNAARLDASAAQTAALGSGDLNATLAADINANTSEGARQLAETATNASMATANRGEAERRYLNRSGQNAKLTGTNRAADLFSDLQDYLQGNRDKIGELRGQSAAAAGAAKQSAAASAASAQSDMYAQQYGAHQDMLDNLTGLLGMKIDRQDANYDRRLNNRQLGLQEQEFLASQQPKPEDVLIPGFDNRMVEALPDEQRSALMLQQFLNPQSGGTLAELMKNPALRSGFYTNKDGEKLPLGGNPLNAEQLMASLGMSSSDPQQQYLLSQIIAQIASGNTDLPYGAQR